MNRKVRIIRRISRRVVRKGRGRIYKSSSTGKGLRTQTTAFLRLLQEYSISEGAYYASKNNKKETFTYT